MILGLDREHGRQPGRGHGVRTEDAAVPRAVPRHDRDRPVARVEAPQSWPSLPTSRPSACPRPGGGVRRPRTQQAELHARTRHAGDRVPEAHTRGHRCFRLAYVDDLRVDSERRHAWGRERRPARSPRGTPGRLRPHAGPRSRTCDCPPCARSASDPDQVPQPVGLPSAGCAGVRGTSACPARGGALPLPGAVRRPPWHARGPRRGRGRPRPAPRREPICCAGACPPGPDVMSRSRRRARSPIRPRTPTWAGSPLASRSVQSQEAPLPWRS